MTDPTNTQPPPPAPKCPRCGADMGVQTIPDDGTFWCGSIKCGHHVGPDSALRELREFRRVNGIDLTEAKRRVVEAARLAGCVTDAEQPPPPATGTPLAEELRAAVRELAPPKVNEIGNPYAQGQDDGQRLALRHVDALLGAHPAIQQPAPVAADGAGSGERRWGVVFGTWNEIPATCWDKKASAESECQHLRAIGVVSARVVPVRVTVLADDAAPGAEGAAQTLAHLTETVKAQSRTIAGEVADLSERLAAAERERAAAERERDDWKGRAEAIAATYTDLRTSNALSWLVGRRGVDTKRVAGQILKDHKGRLGSSWVNQVSMLRNLEARIERELSALMPSDAMTRAAADSGTVLREISVARAALAAPAGGAAVGEDGEA